MIFERRTAPAPASSQVIGQVLSQSSPYIHSNNTHPSIYIFGVEKRNEPQLNRDGHVRSLLLFLFVQETKPSATSFYMHMVREMDDAPLLPTKGEITTRCKKKAVYTDVYFLFWGSLLTSWATHTR